MLDALSPVRIAPHLTVTGGAADALALYRWNLELSGELHQSIALAEVVLRNAIDAQLRAWNARQPSARAIVYNADWIKQPARPLWAILNPAVRVSGRRQPTYPTASHRTRPAAISLDGAHP
ncbi:MAG: hypothetical protein LBQ06_07550, partial [Frankiaceae bacterium]|nr:hypothetical protein [Frankiaceae bacterium]